MPGLENQRAAFAFFCELRAAGVTVSGPEPGLLLAARARPERRRKVARFDPATTNGVAL